MSLSPSTQLTNLLQHLQKVGSRHHRFMLWLMGDTEEGKALAHTLLHMSGIALERIYDWPCANTNTTPSQLLGSEFQAVVFDAGKGFDPDLFGALAGGILGGGGLILVTPEPDRWQHQGDQQVGRFLPWPCTPDLIPNYYLQRLCRLLEQEDQLLRLRVHDLANMLPTSTNVKPKPSLAHIPTTKIALTKEQQEAYEAILRTATGRAHRPLVITAHRGRGKSTVLALAAAELAHTHHKRILISAPQRYATETFYRHLSAELDIPTSQAETQLSFCLPLDLANYQRPVDLLIVDEAAGIPTKLLTSLLGKFPRIIFSTTIHGYEGTGRGFALRFMPALDKQTPNWRHLHLTQPVRWASEDPLEAMLFRTLLLDAPLETFTERAIRAEDTELRIVPISAKNLWQDEACLRNLFGLLVGAHYQTRPSDLRLLLDTPDAEILLAFCNKHLLGGLIAFPEGGLTDPLLIENILRGTRRVRGHLLPQSLSLHAGLSEFTQLRFYRIQRIAVHPQYRQQGIGSALIKALMTRLKMRQIDLIGSSFGATPELLKFWRQCGFHAVHLGYKQNSASGEYAAIVLSTLSEQHDKLIKETRSDFLSHFALLLAGPFRKLSAEVALALLTENSLWQPSALQNHHMDSRLSHQLQAFTQGHLPLNALLPRLQPFIRHYLPYWETEKSLTHKQAQLLLTTFLQLLAPAESAARLGFSGQPQTLIELRQTLGKLTKALVLTESAKDF